MSEVGECPSKASLTEAGSCRTLAVSNELDKNEDEYGSSQESDLAADGRADPGLGDRCFRCACQPRAGGPARELGAYLVDRLAARGARRLAMDACVAKALLAAAAQVDRPLSRIGEVKNRVRELRTARGLSQGELAAAVDVSRQTINSIERERYTPSLPLALALARYFGSSVEEMFDADH